MRSSRPSRRHRLKRVGFAAAMLLCALLAFGISGADEAALRDANAAAGRWQRNPEFRSVAIEYSVLGSRALRTRPFLVRGQTLILTLRSIPFLPERFAVNPTSRSHYDNFDNGPLCAYLYLCGEQSWPQFADTLAANGGRPRHSEQQLLLFLDSFHTDFPVCKDAGAVESAASLARDIAPGQRLLVRENVGPLLLPHVRVIAGQLRISQDVTEMSPEQQLAVLERLDGQVRRQDPELWRAKQLSDFCAGIWAQVYSPPYQVVIGVLIVLHHAGRIGLIAMLCWLAVRSASHEAAGGLLRERTPSPRAAAQSALAVDTPANTRRHPELRTIECAATRGRR